ncbi:MAG: hypothetical protein U5L09_06245 [Bacteroidales bacterium]|nr:hypothetical protein [Bacteroidales bacterium]
MRKGDMVFVEKGGEIIPKMTDVDTSQRVPDAQEISFISHCPECGTPLKKEEGSSPAIVLMKRAVHRDIKGRLHHYISRKAMNIDSLGEGKIEILYDAGLINSVADLYDLKKEQVLGLKRSTAKAIT